MSSHGALLESEEKPSACASLALAVYLPSALCSFAHGLAGLALPLVVVSWGAPAADFAYFKSVAEVAELLANVPASQLLVAWGAASSMAIGSAAFTCASVGLGLAPELFTLAAAYLVQCAAVKVFNRGRGSIMKDLPKQQRGRASGMLVTTQYAAACAAPPAVALMTEFMRPQQVFFAHVVLGLLMALAVAVAWAHWPATFGSDASKASKPSDPVVTQTVPPRLDLLCDVEGRRGLFNVAATCACVSALRGAYSLILPVAGLALKVPVATISLTMAVSKGVSLGFAWLGGNALDRIGRRPCGVCGMALFALGHTGMWLAGRCGEGLIVPILIGSAVLLGFADSLCSPLGHTLKGDAAAREEERAIQLGVSDINLRRFVARYFAVLDTILDAFGILYPIVLVQVATRLDICSASAVFAVLGFVGIPLTWRTLDASAAD